jgi:hypothetical protein
LGLRNEEETQEIVFENRANLKRLTQAELLAFKQSPTISYGFYVLVKAELERRRLIYGKNNKKLHEK